MSNEKQSFFGYTKKGQEDAIERLLKFLKDKEVQQLKENIAYLEKAASLSLSMKRDLLKHFELSFLAMAFKMSTTSLLKGFLNEFSVTMKKEFLHDIQQEFKIGQVIDAQKKLASWLRQGEKTGQIVLCEISNATLV
jgi:flagellar motor switch protein FliG